MEFFNPVHIVAGQGTLCALDKSIKKLQLQINKILLITRGGDFQLSAGYKQIRAALNEYEVHEIVFGVSNPDISELFQLLKELESVDFDLVIAVGGGSVLDMGKSIATLHKMELADVAMLRECIGKGSYTEAVIPWLGIPTTSGTGSEVTPWATIWDKESGGKLSLNNPKNFAHIAVVDPILTRALPVGLTVSSALDAVCHATEAYWAKRTNEVSQTFALAAIRRIRESLELLLQNPEDLSLREDIGKGSLYAGIAFSNTKTTICHSLSYPLTSQFGIPHGIAAALSLAAFMKLNEVEIKNKQELLTAFNCENVAEVEKWIQRMMQLGGYGHQLQNYGIELKDFPQILHHAFTKGRADNNPVVVTKDAVLTALKNIY